MCGYNALMPLRYVGFVMSMALVAVSIVAMAVEAPDSSPPPRWCGTYPSSWSVMKSSDTEIVFGCTDLVQFLAEVNHRSEWQFVYDGPNSGQVFSAQGEGIDPRDLHQVLVILHDFGLRVASRNNRTKTIHLRRTAKFDEGDPTAYLGPTVTPDQFRDGWNVVPVKPGTCQEFTDNRGVWTWCNRMPLEAALEAFSAHTRMKLGFASPPKKKTCISFVELPDIEKFLAELEAYNIHVASKGSDEIVLTGEPQQLSYESCVSESAGRGPASEGAH